MLSIFSKVQRYPYAFSVLKINNPYSGKLIKQVEETSIKTLDKKCKHLQQSRLKWKSLSFEQRNRIMQNFHECLLKKKTQFVNQIVQSTGKIYRQSNWQVQQTLKMIKHQIETSFQMQINQHRSKILMSGYGNILSIYNSSIPLLSASKYLIKSLKSINSLMLSPTEQALPITLKLQECWNNVTDNKHALIVCMVSSKNQRKFLIDHIVRKDQTGFVSYSGNFAEGLKLYKSIGQNDDCFAESQFLLDSFDAVYVRNDANLQQAVDRITKGIVNSAGSIFCSIKRIYIDQTVHDQFKLMFMKKINQLKAGDPKNQQSQISCASSIQKIQKIKEKIKLLRSLQYLKQLTTQTEQEKAGSIIRPKIFQVVDQGIGLFQTINTHQNFNFPFSLLYKVRQGDNPTERINFATNGITFSIFSKDTRSAIEFGRNIVVGTVNVNNCDFNPMLPYSGRKRSGKGLTFSNFSMQNILRTKAISW